MHISISRQSWFLRLFIAAWGVDPEELNFCKFFWGTLFIWLVPVARISRLAGYLIKPMLGLGVLVSGIALLGIPFTAEPLDWDLVLALALAFVFMIVTFFATGVNGNPLPREDQARWLQSLTAFMEKFLMIFLRPFQMAVAPAKIPAAREIRGITDMFGTFYHVVKSRTCPEVRVI
ncbi:MAG: hypothetical protein HYV55_00765 [Parcubacteria group bacterium]|nr:hypothetical protein [Parcubacteria group bacterium]